MEGFGYRDDITAAAALGLEYSRLWDWMEGAWIPWRRRSWGSGTKTLNRGGGIRFSELPSYVDYGWLWLAKCMTIVTHLGWSFESLELKTNVSERL